jgi:hypothetical protein
VIEDLDEAEVVASLKEMTGAIGEKMTIADKTAEETIEIQGEVMEAEENLNLI